MTSLITGFALSMQPVSAETITTDTNGLDAGEVKVPVADGSIPAYRAMPAQGGPFPIVLVVQEVFGVHEHIKDICRRFAKAGYYAIAPELYARQGDPVEDTPTSRTLISEDRRRRSRPSRSCPISTRPSRLGQIDRQGRHRKARGDRLLLGRPGHVAVRRAQPGSEGRRRVVRIRPQAERTDAQRTRSTSPPM